MATARSPYGFGDRDKKHDDTSKPGRSSFRSILHALVAIRKRRIVLTLFAGWLLYLFIKNIPTDVPPVSERIDPRYGRFRPQAPTRPLDYGPQQGQEPVLTDQLYDGPIKYFKLGSTLKPFDVTNRNNVLFAFASPNSASSVLIAACAMANYNRTNVHVAAMGRKEMGLAEILALNGISEADCPVRWHEAQPDFAQRSTIQRMQISCEAAVGHIHRVLPIDVIFFDDTACEDSFLRDALKGRTRSLGLPHLQLPNPDSWMLRLDTASLKQWDQVQIDILVHVPRDSSGGILRLLRSIRDADYSGLAYPRITLELAPQTDPFIVDYLGAFRWPPHSSLADSKLAIRARIDSNLMTPAIASSRFVESFYPARRGHSHVLVLSADAELSSNYYQFLMYLLLEYKYGGNMESISPAQFGISLTAQSGQRGSSDRPRPVTLWQKPSAEAALYFGDEWVQFHDFLKHRLSSDSQLSQTIDAELSLPADWPTWVRIAMEWMQIRGNFMVYPSMEDVDSPLVTVHSELQQRPEEYASREAEETAVSKALNLGGNGIILTAEGKVSQPDREQSMLSTPSLADVLSRMATRDSSLITDVGEVVVYNYVGEAISWSAAAEQALAYSERFARIIGKCPPHAEAASLEKEGFSFLFCEDQSDSKT